MRLATIVTSSGPRLHVRGRSGYVDVAAESGNPEFAALARVLRAGPQALDAVRALAGRDGREYGPDDLGPAVPSTPRSTLCSSTAGPPTRRSGTYPSSKASTSGLRTSVRRSPSLLAFSAWA